MVALVLFFLIVFSVPIACNKAACKDDYGELWKIYKVKFRKNHHFKDEGFRRMIWEQNVLQIMKHNLEADFGLHSFKLELNKFSDLTESELDAYRKCFTKNENAMNQTTIYYECNQSCFQSLPQAIDWRNKNFVTPVKDQGDCGSCWAFSATGALEGQTKAKSGYLVSLSEQNLVDCSWKEGNNGCDGGWMDYAFTYVIRNQGINTEKVYPYKGKDGVCKFVPSEVGANCTGFVKIHKGREKNLQAAVANIGPVSVAIDAGGYGFMNYKEGIYYDKTCSKTDLNHAVLVVGYGTENGTDYWIVKNSWGTSWGMDGYILMSRNAFNQCGIASHAVYPVV